jgi:uracil-DNA glycosylase family 4
MAQVYLLKPKVIISLGKDVSSFLLDMPNAQMKDMRGKVFDYDVNRSIKVVSAFHPSYIARSGGVMSKQFSVLVNDFKLAYLVSKGV